MRYLIPLLLPFVFISCNIIDAISPTVLFVFFAVLFVILIIMFIYTIRSRKRIDKAMLGYSIELQKLIDGISDPKKKVQAVEANINNILTNERYKKDTVNRNKILVIAYEKLAIIHYQQEEHDKVLGICSKIIEIDTGNMMAYYNRGTLLGNLGMYSKAEQDLTEAINLDSSYANTYNNRGMVYEKMGELEKAATDYGYALELEETAISYYNRANVYYKQKDRVKALTDYKKALELNSMSNPDLEKNINDAIKRLEKDFT